MIPTDAELIHRTISHDDRAAFGELVRRHQSAVRTFLRHLTRGNSALADDLAQDTFVAAYRSLGRYRQVGTFSTWLLGIAHNLWRNTRRQVREHDALEEQHADESLAQATSRSDLRSDLATAMQQLTADEQLAIHLGYQQGLSHSEMAALLAWPLGTVKTHLARGKQKLRQLLATWNPQT